MTDPIVVTLDLIEHAHLGAGGELYIAHLNVLIKPAEDLQRVVTRVRLKINGGQRTVGRPAKKDEVTG